MAVTAAVADPGCQYGEVAKLLWTVAVVAAAAGIFVAVRPRWATVVALAVADIAWVWIDMEGPVVLSWSSTHGLHLADVPIVITAPLLGIAAVRLLLRRRAAGSISDRTA